VPGTVIKPGFVIVFALLACACDESSRPPDNESPPSESQLETSGATSEPEPSVAPSEPEPAVPVEPAPPVGGPHCDQREVGDGEAKCIDYSDHKGVGTPRCFVDIPLGEGPCPSAGVIAKCMLPATGVTLVYYEGTKADAAKQICATIDGAFALP
jgi:hypothetical protein